MKFESIMSKRNAVRRQKNAVNELKPLANFFYKKICIQNKQINF
jgi:hypothetical protein